MCVASYLGYQVTNAARPICQLVAGDWLNGMRKRFHHEWVERKGILHECVILCFGVRLAKSLNTKSLTSARFLLFPSTNGGTCFSREKGKIYGKIYTLNREVS